MSYRNPQIIVDRSAEIWAQAATKFGQTLATGVDNYYKAKKEAEEKKKKIDNAKQLYRNKALLRSQKELNESASKIKDPGLLEQFKTNALNLLNEGEDFTYKGVTYNIGAINAETELAINPNLTADERAAYTQIAMSASTYQTSMLEKTGAVIANLDPLKESGAYQIGTNIDIAGQGTDEYKNLVASNTLLNQSVDGVDTKKELIRRKNEDGSYSNIVSINASFDTKSDVWKQLKDAYNLTDEDANFTWERDVDKWAGEGSLVVKLEPDVETDEALQAAGFIDDKHNQTSKGFVSKNITTRTAQDGRDFVTSESHFDVDQLRNDQVYRDALAGKASNILAMEQDQVVKYVGNNLGWGDKITAETLYGKNITEDQRQAFIEEQLFEKDLRRLMPKYQTRQAKQSDVDAYNNDVNIAKDIEAGKTQPLQVGDTLYYNVTGTTSTKVETVGKDTKEVIDISYIKDLKIPVQDAPALESGQRPVDLVALEEQLNREGFIVVKSEEVGPRGINKITITKSVAGKKNHQAVISEEMTPQDIKRNLEFVETGKMPVKTKDEDFSLYKTNQQ
jgi:hypothetical protein